MRDWMGGGVLEDGLLHALGHLHLTAVGAVSPARITRARAACGAAPQSFTARSTLPVSDQR